MRNDRGDAVNELNQGNLVDGPRYLGSNVFLLGGFAFLAGALGLFAVAGFLLYRIALEGAIFVPGVMNASVPEVTAREASIFLGPILIMTAAMICTTVGTRLLAASGAVTTRVIAPQDLAILGPAITAGDANAITQFIRLSSLSGITGTFTKLGLTGLPLATIALTILLALLGTVNSQFFELSKLTLGAFLGSFVQRQADPAAVGDRSRPIV